MSCVTSVLPNSTPLTFTQAGESLEKPVSHTTVWRWARHGLNVGGKQIKLRYIMQGKRRLTFKEWLDEFFVALAEAESGQHAHPANEAMPDSHQVVMHELDKRGI